MIDRDQKEVELFRAIRIRDIEERDEMNGFSDPVSAMYYRLISKNSGMFESWCPEKSGKD